MQTKDELLAAELSQFGSVKLDLQSSRLTTFGLGGNISYLVEPRTVQEVSGLLQFLAREALSYKVLGAGSNVIIPDHGVSQIVIRFGRLFNETFFLDRELNLDSFNDPDFFRQTEQKAAESFFSFAGAALMPLSRKMSQAGLSGLEFAAGIPATVGGAVAMNAGAHGEAIANCLVNGLVAFASGEVALLSNKELNFSYRSNSLPAGSLVLGAEFQLRRGEASEIERRRSECLEYRKKTQPLHLPSAGSVFRNPSASTQAGVGELPAAAQLLEQVGLKGHRQGGVMFSELHSNWLVKVSDEAKAADAIALIELAKSRVQSEYGVDLEAEIKIF